MFHVRAAEFKPPRTYIPAGVAAYGSLLGLPVGLDGVSWHLKVGKPPKVSPQGPATYGCRGTVITRVGVRTLR